VQLDHGSLLFAFTDGAPDALNCAGDEFGRERLFSFLQEDASAEALLSEIGAQLRDHMAGTEQFDDITLLAVKRLEIPLDFSSK
jgi:sigma-B regulation protein RsbU (phosphoserine phosphatase)